MKKTNEKELVKKPRNGIIIGIIFIISGILLIIPTINYFNTYDSKSKSFITTKGKITDYTSIGTEDYYRYVVEYEVDGKTYKIISSPKFFKKKKGTYIDIKYNPNNPEDAIFVNENQLIKLPVGIILLISCGAQYIYDSKKRLKNNMK